MDSDLMIVVVLMMVEDDHDVADGKVAFGDGCCIDDGIIA